MGKLITSQRDVLALLANPSNRFSVWEGKCRVVNQETNEVVARVQNGMATRLLDRNLLAYNGEYKLTAKGRLAARKAYARVNAKRVAAG